MNKEIDSIFERIKDELKDGSFQYYSSATKSHYLYVGNKLIFIINLNELGPEPSKVGLYVIRYEKAGEVPIESFISSIPLSELEDYIYRVVSSIEDITEINKEYFHLQEENNKERLELIDGLIEWEADLGKEEFDKIVKLSRGKNGNKEN